MHGEKDPAAAAFEEFRHLPDTFPHGVRWAATLAETGMVTIGLGDTEVAAAVYRKLLPLSATAPGTASGGGQSAAGAA